MTGRGKAGGEEPSVGENPWKEPRQDSIRKQGPQDLGGGKKPKAVNSNGGEINTRVRPRKRRAVFSGGIRTTGLWNHTDETQGKKKVP